MKNPLLTFLLFLFVEQSSAQHQVGVNVGFINILSNDRQTAPTISVEYAGEVLPHATIGLSVMYEKYSISRTQPGLGMADSFMFNTDYLLAATKSGVSFGKKGYVSVFASGGFGILLAGSQVSIQHYSYMNHNWSTGGVYPVRERYVYDETERITNPIFRIGLGISERIQFHKHWSVKLSEEMAVCSYTAPILSVTVGITYNTKEKVWSKRKRKTKTNTRVLEDSIYK